MCFSLNFCWNTMWRLPHLNRLDLCLDGCFQILTLLGNMDVGAPRQHVWLKVWSYSFLEQCCADETLTNFCRALFYRETAIVFVQKSSKSCLPEAFCEAQNAPQWKSAGLHPRPHSVISDCSFWFSNVGMYGNIKRSSESLISVAVLLHENMRSFFQAIRPIGQHWFAAVIFNV